MVLCVEGWPQKTHAAAAMSVDTMDDVDFNDEFLLVVDAAEAAALHERSSTQPVVARGNEHRPSGWPYSLGNEETARAPSTTDVGFTSIMEHRWEVNTIVVRDGSTFVEEAVGAVGVCSDGRIFEKCASKHWFVLKAQAIYSFCSSEVWNMSRYTRLKLTLIITYEYSGFGRHKVEADESRDHRNTARSWILRLANKALKLCLMPAFSVDRSSRS